ncbi:nuclear transport factor 2 family protein [Streptomyces mirabilis]
MVEALWDRTQARAWSAVAGLVAEDVVVEWPISAERIVGNKNFVAVNSEYPGGWSIRVLRIVADGNEVVSEVEVPHDEFGVFRAPSFWTVEQGRIVRGREYWTSRQVADIAGDHGCRVSPMCAQHGAPSAHRPAIGKG